MEETQDEADTTKPLGVGAEGMGALCTVCAVNTENVDSKGVKEFTDPFVAAIVPRIRNAEQQQHVAEKKPTTKFTKDQERRRLVNASRYARHAVLSAFHDSKDGGEEEEEGAHKLDDLKQYFVDMVFLAMRRVYRLQETGAKGEYTFNRDSSPKTYTTRHRYYPIYNATIRVIRSAMMGQEEEEEERKEALQALVAAFFRDSDRTRLGDPAGDAQERNNAPAFAPAFASASASAPAPPPAPTCAPDQRGSSKRPGDAAHGPGDSSSSKRSRAAPPPSSTSPSAAETTCDIIELT